MMRHCEPGGHDVAECDAQVLRMTVTGSGPGVPVWACHACIRDNGLVPAATFIGRRDLTPILAPARADTSRPH